MKNLMGVAVVVVGLLAASETRGGAYLLIAENKLGESGRRLITVDIATKAVTNIALTVVGTISGANLRQIAQVSNNVFYIADLSTAYRLLRVTITNANAGVLEAVSVGSNYRPAGVASDGTFLYFSGYDDFGGGSGGQYAVVRRAPLNNLTSWTTLLTRTDLNLHASFRGYPGNLVLDGTNMYVTRVWADNTDYGGPLVSYVGLLQNPAADAGRVWTSNWSENVMSPAKTGVGNMRGLTMGVDKKLYFLVRNGNTDSDSFVSSFENLNATPPVTQTKIWPSATSAYGSLSIAYWGGYLYWLHWTEHAIYRAKADGSGSIEMWLDLDNHFTSPALDNTFSMHLVTPPPLGTMIMIK